MQWHAHGGTTAATGPRARQSNTRRTCDSKRRRACERAYRGWGPACVNKGQGCKWEGQGSDASEGWEVPPPPPPGRPAYAHPLSQCQPSIAFATDTNRPQPLGQPPPTACLTASGAASEVPPLLMHPFGAGGGGVEERRGGGSGTHNVVHQRWPKLMFPFDKFTFPRWNRGPGGGGLLLLRRLPAGVLYPWGWGLPPKPPKPLHPHGTSAEGEAPPGGTRPRGARLCGRPPAPGGTPRQCAAPPQ